MLAFGETCRLIGRTVRAQVQLDTQRAVGRPSQIESIESTPTHEYEFIPHLVVCDPQSAWHGRATAVYLMRHAYMHGAVCSVSTGTKCMPAGRLKVAYMYHMIAL
jgi:hypothetical protein